GSKRKERLTSSSLLVASLNDIRKNSPRNCPRWIFSSGLVRFRKSPRFLSAKRQMTTVGNTSVFHTTFTTTLLLDLELLLRALPFSRLLRDAIKNVPSALSRSSGDRIAVVPLTRSYARPLSYPKEESKRSISSLRI